MSYWRYEDRCPACRLKYTKSLERQKTKHHILPKRFFNGKGGKIDICRKCHNELEKRIPQKRMLSKERYLEITVKFIREKNPKFKFPRDI